jgi:hypothetical protein
VVSGISRAAPARHHRGVTKYLIELYVPRGSAPATERLTTAVAAAGAPLRHLQTILVPADEIGFCLVEAPSVAAVAELAESAGLEPERIVEAVAEEEGGIA